MSTTRNGERRRATPGPSPAAAVVPPVLARRHPSPAAPAAARDDPASVAVVPREFGRSDLAGRLWQRAALRVPGDTLIALTAADGGTGRSTLAAALGGLIAFASPWPVLAVDMSGRPWSGLTDRVRDGRYSLWDAYTALTAGGLGGGFGPAVAWTRCGPTRLHVLAAESQRTAQRRPTVFAETAQVVAALGPHTGAVVAELPIADVRPVWQYLTGATTPILVARATVDSIRHTLHLLSQLRGVGLDAVADRAVLAVLAHTPRPPREVRAACYQAADQVKAVVRVPWDAHLARPEPVDVRRCDRPARNALVELAAACLLPGPSGPADPSAVPPP